MTSQNGNGLQVRSGEASEEASAAVRFTEEITMRLVTVRMSDLTDRELDDMAVQVEAVDPGHAAELGRLKAWRQEHPDPPPMDTPGRAYLVVRSKWGRRVS